MAKESVVLIPAIVESVTPDRSQYKPYSTTLVFDGQVSILIPVPAEHVTKKGDEYILTLKGWSIFLDVYTSEIEKMHSQYETHLRQGTPHKPF